MTEEAKARLKNRPRRRCSTCNTARAYTNPLARCLGCKKEYCYDHITAVNGKKGIEDYCDGCLKSI